MTSDLDRYNEWLSHKHSEWEGKCHRCGACCGSLEDPCENLLQSPEGWFYCRVYYKRFGKWQTVSGKELICIPIRTKIAQGHSWPGDELCGYK